MCTIINNYIFTLYSIISFLRTPYQFSGTSGSNPLSFAKSSKKNLLLYESAQKLPKQQKINKINKIILNK